MPRRKKPIPRPAAKSGSAKPLIQGEGDYISAGRYQQEAHQFAKEHDTESLARAAAPRNEAEQREMTEAEKQGNAKARGAKSPRR
jgi:hypothetical protein